MPLGHGEKSLYVLQNFVKVNIHEALAIRHHLHFLDPGTHGNWTSELQRTWADHPYAILVGHADSETALTEQQMSFFYDDQWIDIPDEMKFPWVELSNFRNKLLKTPLFG